MWAVISVIGKAQSCMQSISRSREYRPVKLQNFAISRSLFKQKNISSWLDKGNIIYSLLVEKYIYIIYSNTNMFILWFHDTFSFQCKLQEIPEVWKFKVQKLWESVLFIRAQTPA